MRRGERGEKRINEIRDRAEEGDEAEAERDEAGETHPFIVGPVRYPDRTTDPTLRKSAVEVIG